ncbi:hypothetical protein N7517_003843 [Penicillium concentricum]|uniref:Uncharacterized protein n=1 Tax=Penicillium concentricum TaxID=293559 RepID=A0A9W9S540_9EURO|nr:uncharacterized protein N7517_003843 [Penicillium concentricum]KAJ5371837.1 hypothetical protein N7517_003843 [Penicillium concentricum]
MSSPDYKLLFQRTEEETHHLEQEIAQLKQKTSLLEFLQACHELLSSPVQVGSLSTSTQSAIQPPQGKQCPANIVRWEDCAMLQQEVFDSVCNHLNATQAHPSRLFLTSLNIEGVASLITPLYSQWALEHYEQFTVQAHVSSIVSELCNIPAARQQFRLGDGILFDKHANSSEEDLYPLSPRPSQPDQSCIHQVGGRNTLLMYAGYKPPYELSVESLRVGLRPMKFWEEVVRRKAIPTDISQKLKYNAEQLVGSALVQEYHVMIREGLEYSYLTTGVALVLLHIPHNDPRTLMYSLCEPNIEVHNDPNYQKPKTAIARILCLALMASLSSVRDQNWRKSAKAQLKTWATSFSLVRSHIPDEELGQTPPVL